MKKLCILFAVLALLAACSSTTEPPAPEYDAAVLDYTQFAGKNLGVPTGNLAEQVIRDIGGTPVFFPDLSAEQAIVDSFNAFLAELEAGGTLAEMQNRWLEGVPASSMPDITTTGENDTLTIATTGDGMPFSYSGVDGTLTGYSIELALRFAASEGKTAEFVTMDFAELIPYVAGSNADLGLPCL